jgi:hypothetical protein
MADGVDEDFNVKLVGDGISIDKTVNRKVAMAVVAAVLGGGAATPSVGKRDADERSRERPTHSPREFLTESRASTNSEQITALGYHLCDQEAKENFSKDDLREAFRRAHEVIPKNLPRDVGIAIEKGWIHEAPGKTGRYYVTKWVSPSLT